MPACLTASSSRLQAAALPQEAQSPQAKDEQSAARLQTPRARLQGARPGQRLSSSLWPSPRGRPSRGASWPCRRYPCATVADSRALLAADASLLSRISPSFLFAFSAIPSMTSPSRSNWRTSFTRFGTRAWGMRLPPRHCAPPLQPRSRPCLRPSPLARPRCPIICCCWPQRRCTPF